MASLLWYDFNAYFIYNGFIDFFTIVVEGRIKLLIHRQGIYWVELGNWLLKKDRLSRKKRLLKLPGLR